MQKDVRTGRYYTVHNIPMGRLNHLVIPRNAEFCIMNENYGHESDVWYNETFCGDRYAVFKRTVDTMCWQQVSPWYVKYGTAERKMISLYNDKFYESEVK